MIILISKLVFPHKKLHTILEEPLGGDLGSYLVENNLVSTTLNSLRDAQCQYVWLRHHCVILPEIVTCWGSKMDLDQVPSLWRIKITCTVWIWWSIEDGQDPSYCSFGCIVMVMVPQRKHPVMPVVDRFWAGNIKYPLLLPETMFGFFWLFFLYLFVVVVIYACETGHRYSPLAA